jgi:hypothetical protein
VSVSKVGGKSRTTGTADVFLGFQRPPRSRRDPVDAPILNPEQAAEAERIFQALRPVVEAELRRMTRLLASKPDDKLLGEAEFEVRDRVHAIGAKALEAALDGRKKGGIMPPA